MSGIIIGLGVFSSIIGLNYGLYRLGMWSQKTKLISLREKLNKQHPKDTELIDEITTHIKEIDLYVNNKIK